MTSCVVFVFGPTGSNGDIGSTGPTGQKGEQGITGQTGSTGNKGPQGITGNIGPIGLTGNIGQTGDKGSTGNDGNIGNTGDTGDIGDTGETGPTGNNGSTGYIGYTGSMGDTGPTGNNAYFSDEYIYGIRDNNDETISVSGPGDPFILVPISTVMEMNGTWSTTGTSGTFTVGTTGVYLLIYNVTITAPLNPNGSTGGFSSTITSKITVNSITISESQRTTILSLFSSSISFRNSCLLGESFTKQLSPGDEIAIYVRAVNSSGAGPSEVLNFLSTLNIITTTLILIKISN